jgi:hypothetical protein
MQSLAFSTTLDSDNVIHIPHEIAVQLPEGAVVQVSITVQTSGRVETADETWQSIVEFALGRRTNAAPQQKPYHWRREDAYDHLP